jgi:hypothetical protein
VVAYAVWFAGSRSKLALECRDRRSDDIPGVIRGESGPNRRLPLPRSPPNATGGVIRPNWSLLGSR